MSGAAELDAMLAKLRALPDALRGAPAELADVIRDDIEQHAAAGRDPYGEPWKRRKDGGAPLATAGKSIAVAAVGSRVFVRITKHVGRHHHGRAKGGVVRRVIPTGEVPPTMAKAIKRSLAELFADAMREG